MNEHADHLRRLIDLLAEQLGLLGELEDALLAQRFALLSRESAALDESTAAVERLGRLMKGADGRRQRVLEGLSERTGLPLESLGLSRLADLGGPSEARRLTHLRHELRLRLHRVERLRGQLGRLLERNANFARRHAEKVAALGLSGGTYGRDARVRPHGGDGRFIDRTI